MLTHRTLSLPSLLTFGLRGTEPPPNQANTEESILKVLSQQCQMIRSSQYFRMRSMHSVPVVSSLSKVKCHPIVKQALSLAGTWRDAIETMGNLQGIAPMTEHEVVQLLRCCSRLPGSLWSTQLIYFTTAQKILLDEVPSTLAVGESSSNSLTQEGPTTGFTMPLMVVEAMVGIALNLKQRKLARYIAQNSGVEPCSEIDVTRSPHQSSTGLMLLRLYSAEGKWRSAMKLWGSQFALRSSVLPSPILDQVLFHLTGALGRRGKWELATQVYGLASTKPGLESSAVSTLLCLAPHRWTEGLIIAARHYATSATSLVTSTTEQRSSTSISSLSSPWVAHLRQRYDNVEGRFLVALLRLSETQLRSWRADSSAKQSPMVSEHHSVKHPEAAWVTAIALYGTVAEIPERRRFASTAALSLLYHQLIEVVDEHIRDQSYTAETATHLKRVHAPIRFTNPIITLKKWENLLFLLSNDYAQSYGVPMLMKSLPQLIIGLGDGWGHAGIRESGAALVSPQYNSFRPRIVVADTNVVLQVLYSGSFDTRMREVIQEATGEASEVTILLPFTVVKEVVAHIRFKWKARGFGLHARKAMYKRFKSLFNQVQGDAHTPTRSIRWVALSPLQDAPGLSFLALLPSTMFQSPSDPDRSTLATVLYLEYLCNTTSAHSPGSVEGSANRTGRVNGYSHRAFVNRFGAEFALNIQVGKPRTSSSVFRSTSRGNGPQADAVRPHVLFLTRDQALYKRAIAFGVEARMVPMKNEKDRVSGEAGPTQGRATTVPIGRDSQADSVVHPIYRSAIHRLGMSKDDLVR